MSMGFIVNDTCTHAARVLRTEDCMLRFDSGDGITFEDAIHHLLVLGTTGSGKTASVVLPALYRLLGAGHCGFVADIKGNMRAQVRALAERCGREADIVEYGTGSGALRLNILNGMDRHAMYSFFEGLTLQSFRNASEHLDWHLKGVNVAADCGHLLRLLSALDPMFEPNIVTISEMLMRPAEALKLYKLFKGRVYDRDNEEHALFVGSVEANRFHVLKERTENGKSSETTTDEQMTWTLQSVRQALKSFLDAPGIAGHFAAHGAPGLDMGHILKENKVALLRFGLDTGPIGAALARVLLSRFYAAAYAMGRDLPIGRKCFVAIDEFQEVADFSDGPFSDVSFISQAREFNGIFLASTQSMSALMQRGNSPVSVEAFTSNCNGRVLFYSDDPLTNAMAARYDKDVELNHLEPGTAFVIHYDKAQRSHRFGIETLQEAFASTRDVLGVQEAPSPVDAPDAPVRPSLRALVNRSGDELRSAHAGQKPGAPARERFQKEEKEEDTASTSLTEMEQKQGPDTTHRREDAHCVQEKEEKMTKVMLKNGLAEKFPQFFTNEEVSISIPVGWRAFAERAFTAFAATGLEVTLVSVGLSGNTLRAVEAENATNRLRRSESGATRFLNSLLRRSEAICALCGEPITAADQDAAETAPQRERPDEDFFNSGSDSLPICRKCLHQYELDGSCHAQRGRM